MVFVVAIPLLSVVVFGIMLLTIPLYKKVQARLDGVTRRDAGEPLRRAGAAGLRQGRGRKGANSREKNQGLTTLQKMVGRVSALMNPLTYAMINGAIVALIYQAGAAGGRGGADPGPGGGAVQLHVPDSGGTD